MYRYLSIGFVTALACLVPTAAAQTVVNTGKVQVSFENQMLRGAVLREDGLSGTRFLGDYYRFRAADLAPEGNYLAAYSARFYGIERYEASTPELLLTGIGTGAQLGFFAGAVGNMLGWWDEDASWLMMGAMSALGAAWAGTHLDDPSWRFQYRWEDDPMTVPTK